MHDILLTVIIPLESTGIFDWFNEKNASAQAAARGFSITAAIIFVIVTAIISKLAAARVIIAGIIAGIFVWIVFNVTDLENRVDNEMSGGVAAVQAAPDHPHA